MRHAYGVELAAARLAELAEGLGPLHARLQGDLDAFAQALRGTS